MSYRQLTVDEEKYEENVWQAWEAFLLQMQDASEFVNTQTPLMTQLLEDSYVVSLSSSDNVNNVTYIMGFNNNTFKDTFMVWFIFQGCLMEHTSWINI